MIWNIGRLDYIHQFFLWTVENTTGVDIDEFIKDLTIAKKETNAYERSLNCADDPRPSSKAIGATGIIVLCVVVGFVVLADCQCFFKPVYNRKDRTCDKL